MELHVDDVIAAVERTPRVWLSTSEPLVNAGGTQRFDNVRRADVLIAGTPIDPNVHQRYLVAALARRMRRPVAFRPVSRRDTAARRRRPRTASRQRARAPQGSAAVGDAARPSSDGDPSREPNFEWNALLGCGAPLATAGGRRPPRPGWSTRYRIVGDFAPEQADEELSARKLAREYDRDTQFVRCSIGGEIVHVSELESAGLRGVHRYCKTHGAKRRRENRQLQRLRADA